MSFKKFLSDKVITIILLIFVLATVEIFLIVYPFDWFIRLYIPVSVLSAYFVGMYAEYRKRKKYYTEMNNIIDALEEKYLFGEMIEQGEFFDAEIMESVFYQTNKAMIENINQYKYRQNEYKEYIEMWIHDIKIPIAAGKMIVENNKNDVTKSIDEELDKIEAYTENALYYARSSTAEKDYIIKTCHIRDIVSESIRQNKKYLIRQKCSINFECEELTVPTDSKWVVFILNQIINNSIKYSSANPTLTFSTVSSDQNSENVTLTVTDNGAGIPADELNRVFEKGFTGTNGRNINQKSTGIGLYLCKKLCDKLNIGISVKSTLSVGTSVTLTFPKGTHHLLQS